MAQTKWLAEKLNIGEKDEMEIRGYRRNWYKFAATLVAILLTFGVLLIFILWRKDLKLRLIYEQCALSEATKVLLKDSFGVYHEEAVRKEVQTVENFPYTRFFFNKKIKYVWDDGIMQFVRIRAFDYNKSCDFFHRQADQGLDLKTIAELALLYGENWIRIKVLPIYRLIGKEVVNPLYLAQVYTTTIWVAEGYYDYSFVLVAMAIVAVCLSVRQTRIQMTSLRKMFDVTGTVTVLREGTEREISSVELVPGDIILIPVQGPQILHCDAVLLQGTCSMDESMLTGESHPITKISLPREPNEDFSYEDLRRHILFCGTHLIQGRGEDGSNYVKAVVIRTGFMTQKGELVRAILFPKPVHMRFYGEVVKCVAFFFVFGLAGMIFTLYSWAKNGATVAEIILNGLDISTIALPFGFPAALTAINAFAQKRLKKNGIFCLNSRYVSVAGSVDVVCFDKTGTLTENDLDIAGTVPVQEGVFRQPVKEVATLTETHPVLVCMATCHSLIQLDSGEFGGYSTDKKMFQDTKWIYRKSPTGIHPDFGCETEFTVHPPSYSAEEPSDPIAVLKIHPFESTLQKMTVLTKKRSHIHHDVYIKGAPEAISALCDPLTVPHDFRAVLNHYTLQGYRVLALAVKTIPGHMTLEQIQSLTREELESNAELIGLLVIENSVKSESLPALKALHQARLKTVMVTGDNLQTAITVGKESGLLNANDRVIQVSAKVAAASALAVQHLQVRFTDPLSNAEFIGSNMKKLQPVHAGNYCFAVDGSSFELLCKHDPSLVQKVIHRGKIFARMSPAHKQELMERLQDLGHQVAMVGDGCNDCGALKAANIGVSLSMTDASVAAPFTSTTQNISCVPILLREGRGTITAVYQTFIYGMSISFMLFISLLFMYSISVEPSDFQYLVFTYPLFIIPYFTYGIAEPSSYLHKRRPIGHIWSFLPIFSFLSFLAWQSLIFTIGWYYCRSQSWFVPYKFRPGVFPSDPSYEETTMYFLICISTVSAALTFTPSPPYTKPIFKKKIFAGWTVFAFILLTCLVFITEENFIWWMNFKPAPYPEYTAVIYVLGLTGGFICFVWEKYMIKGLLHQWLWPKINTMRPMRHAYQRIEMELISKTNWPRLGYEEDLPLVTDHQRSVDTGSINTAAESTDRQSGFRQSFRDFIGRTTIPMSPGKMSFRTFRNKQGAYTINGPMKSSSSSNSDGIIAGPTKRDTAKHVKISIDEEAESYLPPPPPEDEIFQMDEEIQMIGLRMLETDEQREEPKQVNEDSSDNDEVFLGNKTAKFQFHDAEEDADTPGVELLSYVKTRRESDVSPSRQRRHLNGSIH